MVDLSVALPVFKGKNIFWLAMESLCRQRDINFSWELLIAEEQINPYAGKRAFYEYSDRLEKIGCKEIKYIPLREWMPLSQKWALLGKNADSEMFVCHADDNYSQPYRLREVYNNIDKDYICYPSCLFYFIKNNTVYEHTVRPYRKSTRPGKGLHYSFKTKYAKKIPNSDRAIIVDQWIYDFIYKGCKNKINHRWIISDHWKEGFNTHGFHRLSHKRYSKYQDKVKDASKYSHNWPEDILQKMRELKGISIL